MKYLVVLLVLGTAIWLWRSNRHAERSKSSSPPKKEPPQGNTHMVVCQHCGVHLPETEATQGIRGYYCDPQHRSATEG